MSMCGYHKLVPDHTVGHTGMVVPDDRGMFLSEISNDHDETTNILSEESAKPIFMKYQKYTDITSCYKCMSCF